MKISLKRQGDNLIVSPRGDLTEQATEELQLLKQKVEVQSIVFDLANVDLINSLGVRAWSEFVQWLRDKEVTIQCINASPAFVEVFNCHENVASAKEVVSFQVPMACSSCDANTLVTVESADLETTYEIGKHACGKCKQVLLPEVDLESYTIFLR